MTPRAEAWDDEDLGPDDVAEPAVHVDGPETVAEERLLSSLRERARAVNRGRVLRLVDLVGAAAQGRLDEQGRQEAEGLAHQVVGSAGTFGSPDASRQAATVERWFAGRDGGGRARRRREGAHPPADVREALDRLRDEFEG